MNLPRHLRLLFAVALIGAWSGCGKLPPTDAGLDIDYYTCTMHPSVRLKEPGNCPICGMDLVPVRRPGTQSAAHVTAATAVINHEFTVPLERQLIIGVTYATVAVKPLRRTLRLLGMVAPVTSRHWDYVARVDGYIHELKVAGPGDRVKKGQVLLDLYSPDLVATENEYVDLARMRADARRTNNAPMAANADRMLSGARARLRQWDLSDSEIAALETKGRSGEWVSLASPVDGIVEELLVHQGRHVSVGDHLVDLVDLSEVWVWADVHEADLPLVKPGLSVRITAAGLPDLVLDGRTAVVDPFLSPATRTAKVRIDLANPGGRLRPNAFVNVALELDEGEGLTVPAGAVLPTGERNLVFVDRGSGRLEPRAIEVGGEYGGSIHVRSGLKAGERVVASGNFLIDAESKVQGALNDF